MFFNPREKGLLRNLALDAVTKLVNNLQGKTPLPNNRQWGNPLLTHFFHGHALFLWPKSVGSWSHMA